MLRWPPFSTPALAIPSQHDSTDLCPNPYHNDESTKLPPPSPTAASARSCSPFAEAVCCDAIPISSPLSPPPSPATACSPSAEAVPISSPLSPPPSLATAAPLPLSRSLLFLLCYRRQNPTHLFSSLSTSFPCNSMLPFPHLASSSPLSSLLPTTKPNPSLLLSPHLLPLQQRAPLPLANNLISFFFFAADDRTQPISSPLSPPTSPARSCSPCSHPASSSPLSSLLSMTEPTQCLLLSPQPSVTLISLVFISQLPLDNASSSLSSAVGTTCCHQTPSPIPVLQPSLLLPCWSRLSSKSFVNKAV